MPSYIRTSRTLTHWKDYGGSGDLLVLVHGLGGSVANWDAVGPRLSELGRTVALDLPGFGLSPPESDWELETHAEAIVAFISELGPSASLIGNSLGGLLSEIIASQHPDLVDSLVLVSPATPPRLGEEKVHWPTARRLLVQALPLIGPLVTRRMLAGSTPRQIVQTSLEMVTQRPGRVPMDMIDEFVHLARVRSHLPWAASSMPKTGNAIARLFLHRSRFVSMIRRIEAPTLVVHGLEDRIVSPASICWLGGLRPDWKLVQMEDTAHTPHLDSPVRFLSIIVPWLADHLKSEHRA